MKKVFLLIGISLCLSMGHAQTLTPNSTSVVSGSTVVLTAAGESNSSYFGGLSYSSGLTTVTPAGNYVVVNNVQLAGYPWATSGNPTKYSFVITAPSATGPVTATLTFNCTFLNGYGNPTVTATRVITLTVTQPTGIFWNVAKSGAFTRNNCSSGLVGSTVTYTVPAHTYSASTQSAADALATAAVNANGQANANANGTCTNPCPTTTMSGIDNFCSSENYILYNLPSSTTSILWTVTGDVAISGSNNQSSVLVTAINQSSSGTLTATITSTACGTVTLTKNLYTYPALSYFIFTGWAGANNGIMSQGQTLSAEVGWIPNASYYEWWHNGSLYGTTSYPWIEIFDWSCEVSYPTLNVRAMTPCGYTDYVGQGYSTDCGYGYYSYSVYPNPVSDELTVNAEEKSTAPQSKNGNVNKPIKEKSFEIKLYDGKGKVLKAAKNDSSKKSVVINTQDIPNGTYFLHIIEGKNITKKQIIIKH